MKARMGKTPGPCRKMFKDGHHLALVLESGGMAGCYLAGALQALEDMGAGHVFDSVHGCSVGAHMGAYFVAGQTADACHIFRYEACQPEFISFGNLLRLKPFMNVGWIVRDVFQRLRKLNASAILESATAFYITSTRAADGTPFVWCSHAPAFSLFDALLATAKIPVVAGKLFFQDHVALTDGALSSPFSLHSLEQVKPTHVLVLRTYRPEPRLSSFSRFEYLALRFIHGRALAETYRHGRQHVLSLFETAQPCAFPFACEVFFPPALDNPVGRLTRTFETIDKAILASRDAMRAWLA